MATDDNLPAISPNLIRPYISYIFLKCTATDLRAAFDQLTTHIKRPRSRGGNNKSTILESGFSHVERFIASDSAAYGVNQIDGFVYRLDSNPSWAAPESGYVDSRHLLSITFRRN